MNTASIVPSMAALLVSVVVIGMVLVPIVDKASTETIYVDIEEINENPIGDFRLSYDTGTAISKSFTFTENGANIDITGDLTDSVSTANNQILLGTDNYYVAVKDGSLVVGSAGTVSASSTVTVTIADGQANGSAYAYVYYPDSEGEYANFYTYEYDITEVYAVGGFAGVGIISQGEEVSGTNTYDMTATVEKDAEDNTAGVTYAQE